MEGKKTIEVIESAIAGRRSVFPQSYTKERIPDEVITEVLEMAKYAPSHRLTQPWRFKVVKGKGLKRLSEYLGKYYISHTPEEKYSEVKYQKTIAKPIQSSHVIVICLQRDDRKSVPEWEEIASLAMAVQNIWISLSVRGIGCYWSTPASMVRENNFVELQQGEKCLGLMYLGYVKNTPPMPPREDMSTKIEWIDR